MAEAKSVAPAEVIREGVRALVDRLGPAKAARFIAAMGGEGDSVREVREMRGKSTLDELIRRVQARERSSRK